MADRLFGFAGGAGGAWRVTECRAIAGAPLAQVTRLGVLEGEAASAADAAWVLRGITSNERYVTREEKTRLAASSPALGRAAASRAALIPIRKSAAWWALPQDERRAIFEERSHHIAASLPYLPRIARRLYHCRDLGEPFDFLTWFEFAPEHAQAFDDLVATLRGSEEWAYVEREVDLRLARDVASR